MYELYNDQNCDGYSPEEMHALNVEFASICDAEGIDQGSDDMHHRASAFSDEVSSRG